jgi:hypothetical protein
MIAVVVIKNAEIDIVWLAVQSFGSAGMNVSLTGSALS